MGRKICLIIFQDFRGNKRFDYCAEFVPTLKNKCNFFYFSLTSTEGKRIVAAIFQNGRHFEGSLVDFKR